MTERAMGVTRACGLVGISRSRLHYESRRRIDNIDWEKLGKTRLAFPCPGLGGNYLTLPGAIAGASSIHLPRHQGYATESI
ncbi:hypothetical protein ACQUJZ_13960 [Ralstonia pseudosolanacearum]|uniref:hypothetical protein n=1 Tax=Ralstonia pseudosolanacearum TaxID=1310165 RepID=UPI000FD7258A|nr:hypothetical protein [Ralstonia pseudosolanacearum]MCK4136572.1 hypothetical protein [Ralstonia pseudosolanacearum]UQY81989.1 hypothetical protein JNO62_14210 [Ralstonia pseudosolanacearum]